MLCLYTECGKPLYATVAVSGTQRERDIETISRPERLLWEIG
jgi:hypothetical protein